MRVTFAHLWRGVTPPRRVGAFTGWGGCRRFESGVSASSRDEAELCRISDGLEEAGPQDLTQLLEGELLDLPDPVTGKTAVTLELRVAAVEVRSTGAGRICAGIGRKLGIVPASGMWGRDGPTAFLGDQRPRP